MKQLTILLLFLTTFSKAQSTISIHEMLPMGNAVAAGNNNEYAARIKRTGIYTLLGGGAITLILSQAKDTKETAAPWVSGTVTFGTFIGLNLHSLSWEIAAAAHMQQAFLPYNYYEEFPDSVSNSPPKRFKMKNYVNGQKIHIPARMRMKNMNK